MIAPSLTITKTMITDRLFLPGKQSQYSLALQAGIRGVRLAVLDETGKNCLALGDLKNTMLTTGSGLTEQVRTFGSFLGGLEETVPWLFQPFARQKICWEGDTSALVPSAMLVPGNVWEYLSFGHRLEAGETVLFDPVTPLDAVNIFSIPEKIREMLTLKFNTQQICHLSTAFLSGALEDSRRMEDRPVLYTWLSGQSVDLALIGPGGLKIHNRFPYAATEDVVYYVLYILQQFAVAPEIARVILTGQLEPSGILPELLGKYVNEIIVPETVAGITPGKDLEQAPIHEWYPLFNLFH